jgi:hypothetical protein
MITKSGPKPLSRTLKKQRSTSNFYQLQRLKSLMMITDIPLSLFCGTLPARPPL